MAEFGADVIKTGMLATTGIIETVGASLRKHGPDIPRVVDPVMVAKGGHPLLAGDATAALVAHLVRGAAVLTPNLPEAEVLTGRSVKTIEEMEAAVPALRGLGAQAVLLKGGHLDSPRVIDLLITANDIVRFEDNYGRGQT